MFTLIKKYLFLVFVIFVQPSLSWAEAEIKTPLSYLTGMVEAHKKSTYELLYIMQQNGEIDSFRLRHTFQNNREYAQLLNLEHSREEIILNDQIVSYLGYNFRPFSLNSPHILDNLPNVLYTDFNKLTGYTLLDLGRDRISDRVTRVIKVASSDKYRYSYILWIDEETNILLKSQLQNADDLILEEFRVLQLYQSQELEMMANVIDSLVLPALTSVKKEEIKLTYNWKAGWLPQGFQLIENQTMTGTAYQLESENIDSYLYGDGLSTFNIYVMPSQGVNFNEYVWQQGKLTILNQTIDDKDIVIIGEIPIQSAKQIIKNIEFIEGRTK